jgi:kynurenine formamidase
LLVALPNDERIVPMKEKSVKCGGNEKSESGARKRRLLLIVSGLAIGTVVLWSNGARAQNEMRDVSTADPATQTPNHRVTYEEFTKMRTTLSNWGRWGKDDERGTLNLITPQKTVEASKLIKEGVVVTLAHFPDIEKAVDGGGLKHIVPTTGPNGQPWDWATQPRAMVDSIEFGVHDGQDSHLDAICHYESQDGKFQVYNGHPAGFSAEGCTYDSIEHMGQPIASRGILVDIPLLRGVEYLDPKTAIFADDLEAWEKFAHVKISSGDILMIRGGRWAYRAKHGPFPYGAQGAGLHVSALPWIHQRDVAMLVSDAVNDVQPSGIVGGTGSAPGEMDRPIHNLSMVSMGEPLVDNAYLEDVAKEAAKLKRWEFFVTVSPNRIQHGSASPFNAQAIF